MSKGDKAQLQMPKVVLGMEIVIKPDGSCEDYNEKTTKLLGRGDGRGNLILKMRPDGAVDWRTQVNEDGRRDIRKKRENLFSSTPDQTRVIHYILHNSPHK